MQSEREKTILLVEDEVITAMAQKVDLQKFGYKVIIEYSGEKAIEVFNNNNKIDLILMDIDLGKGIDGTVAAETILKNNEIPIVFLSNHTEPEVVEKTEKITSYGYVVKNTGKTVLDASIKMAFKLFDAKMKERAKEEKLQLSELRFRGLVETSSDWIWEVDAKGVYLYSSPQVEAIIGYKPGEIIGKMLFDFMAQEEAEKIREIFKEFLMDGKPIISLEKAVLHKDCRSIILETSGVPFFDSYGEILGFRGVNRDITKRKHAEEALRKSEMQFRSLYENSPYGIVICQLIKDDHNKTIDFIHLQANSATTTQTGFKLKDLIGKKASEIGSPEEITEPIKFYEQVVSTGKTDSFIQYFPIYNRTLEVTAFPLFEDLFIMNFYDITTRK